jgi:hypothetical protein
MTLADWSPPHDIDDAEAWLRDAAAANGLALTGAIDRTHTRPWSTVCRARTATGEVFLKVCHPIQAHEPALTEIVAREHPSLVPPFIARHPSRPWLLLGNAGTRLRDARAGDAVIGAWERLLPRYAELQRAFVGREGELLAAGVPERRLERLADLLHPVLDDERTSAGSRQRVRDILPLIERACTELAGSGIGPTIDHADLHDNNVFERDGHFTIIDWGDAGVTHPFLSLFVTFRFLELAIGQDTAALHRLRDAYLEPWTAVVPRRALVRAAALGAALGGIPGLLVWQRITTEIEGVRAKDPDWTAEALDRLSAAFERVREP